jgi:hypothetical protein
MDGLGGEKSGERWGDRSLDAGLATNADISSFASAAITYIINGIFVSPFAPTTTFQ